MTAAVVAPVGMSAPRRIALAVLPIVLLVALMAFLYITGGGLIATKAPPVEDLTVQRIALPEPGSMVVHVVNGGPSPVTVAQVAVDDAYWDFTIEPGPVVSRLGSATIRIPYPWSEGEPHEVMLVSSTGVTFNGSVEVALEEPGRDPITLLRFLLVGFYVGVVPVALGMMWFPLMKTASPTSMLFLLSLTVGILAFLLIDTLNEAMEAAAALPGGMHGTALVWLVAIATLLVVEAIGSAKHLGRSPLGIAALVALGIGLHNLGEGLAIGAAYTLGEVALGSFLVLGFTLHNITEGLAIAAPLTRGAPKLRHFVGLVLLAGAPAMLGTVVGAFAYSPLASTLLLAIGAGAVAQVVWVVGRYTMSATKESGTGAVSAASVLGFVAGIALMFATALLVAA